MEIKEIKYMFRRNLGNYEHEELTMLAHLEEGDDLQDCVDTIKEKVLANLGEYLENDNKGSKKKKSSKVEEEDEDETPEEDEEADEEEESEDDSDSDEDSEEEEDEEEDEDEEEKPVKKASKKAPGKKSKSKSESSSQDTTTKKKKTQEKETDTTAGTKKKFRSKMTPYDPKKQLHSKLVGEIVESKYKNWRKKESLVKKSIKASNKMKGEEFLNNDGEVLPDFKKSFLKLMK